MRDYRMVAEKFAVNWLGDLKHQRALYAIDALERELRKAHGDGMQEMAARAAPPAAPAQAPPSNARPCTCDLTTLTAKGCTCGGA